MSNFSYIDALAQVGRPEAACERSRDALRPWSAFELLSEDFDVATGELWDTVSRTCSMAGIINSAMRLSQSWEDRW